ncbi:hypothetical protein S40285_04757 [Stachybotrys chlorohalonatus IBT 40285]|uniref:DUF924-domain-containing protein n=1 Tax=Stachybotrys chlorohalonatus (strain IBT 40285) TaxID=1283841 RepID=A0A084QGR2_STAC4|nr:hypothetical protein S40285_04757 [Stachybotrys chlorohalonata IBT 40285]
MLRRSSAARLISCARRRPSPISPRAGSRASAQPSLQPPAPSCAVPSAPFARSLTYTASFCRPEVASPVNMTDLRERLNPELLRDVRDFWFEHCGSDEDLAFPKKEHMGRWFNGGEALDKLCVERFGPTLEAIRASGVTSGDDIIEAAQPQNPLDWLSLVLLLDQMPRNIYRGHRASAVFLFFDPLARAVVAAAATRGIPASHPETRWRFAYRMWFYLPLMHSEALAAHEQAVGAYEAMTADIESLYADPDGGDELRGRAAAVARGSGDEAREFGRRNALFEEKHYDIIRRFGRYPHRNSALGREPTAEEVEYLEQGGETFSGDKS